MLRLLRPTSVPSAVAVGLPATFALAVRLPATSSRSFSSTPPPRRRPTSSLPDFSWRTPYNGNPRPTVEVINDADDADAVLETITSKRLSIDAEPGKLLHATRAAHRAVDVAARPTFMTSNTSQGVLSIADGEGIILLHLARMQRAPRMLKQIMEDASIEKQTFGAAYMIREFLHAADFFDHTRPRNVLCLRRAAENAWPELGDPQLVAQPHNVFAQRLAECLGLRYTVHDASERNYHTQRLQGPALELLANQSWFIHCASPEIRDKLASRIDKKVSWIPGIQALRERFTGDKLMENFKLDYEIVEEALKRKGYM
ncbi:hypothetical protein JCM10207_006005 [Rhodosporidiobolus poonsookiae]